MHQITPGPRLDDDGRIAEPTPCRTCGYDLQGLDLTGICPECSGSIRRSARGDLLRYSSPDWLRRLSRGMLVAVIGTIATTVLIVATSAAGGVIGGLQMQQVGAIRVALGFAAMLACGVTVVMVVGVWMVTEPDPKTATTEATMSARVLARYGILVAIVSVPLQMLSPGTTSPAATVAFIASAVLSILSLVGWVALLVHLRQLALRIPRLGLARQTRIVLWGYAIFTSLTTLGGVGASLLAPTLAGGGAGGPTPAKILLIILAAAAVIGFLLYIVFEIWFIILMCLYYAAFSAEAVAAGQGDDDG